MSGHELTAEAMALPLPERAKLAETLLRSLDPATDEDVEQEWDAEVTRRLQRVRDGSAKGKPAEQVFRAIRPERQISLLLTSLPFAG
jgi:putative addiction module component (TIGR02574 family)